MLASLSSPTNLMPPFPFRQAVGIDINIDWNIYGLANNTKDILWNVRNLINKTNIILYNTYAQVNNNETFNWHTSSSAYNILSLDWNVLRGMPIQVYLLELALSKRQNIDLSISKAIETNRLMIEKIAKSDVFITRHNLQNMGIHKIEEI